MRRVAVLAAAAAILTAAALMPGPDPAAEPEFSGPVDVEVVAPESASVWYCPWINSGAESDAAFLLTSIAGGQATVTMPSPVQNESADTAVEDLFGPGSRNVDVGSVVRRGDAPGFVEFAGGPATASSAVWADGLLTGDRCTASVPRLWYLPGGTTRTGRDMTLRLFNPFPEGAKVTVTGASELGPEPLPELTSIDVPGRTWTNIEMNPMVPFLDTLSLVVATEEGIVIPSLAVAGETDEASWPGTELSTSWFFPMVTQAGLTPSLVVMNPGAEEVAVFVDVYDSSAFTPDAIEASALPGVPLELPLRGIVSGPTGINVRATGAVTAALVAQDVPSDGTAGDEDGADETVTDRIATTVGAVTPAQRWLLAGAGGLAADAASSIYLLNPSGAEATITLQKLGTRRLAADKVIVGPGTTRRVRLDGDPLVGAYLVEATVPIVAGWTARQPDAIAFFAGVAVDE